MMLLKHKVIVLKGM
jgi:hypothetical protein